jgi:hypothetical protein
MDDQMFCPHCGAAMTLVPGHGGLVFKCVVGDMPLSRSMHDILTAAFFGDAPVDMLRGKPYPRFGDRHFSGDVESQSHWFCPRDGSRMLTRRGM